MRLLFTHCHAVQLSVMTNFVILNRRAQPRIKNCYVRFFGADKAKQHVELIVHHLQFAHHVMHPTGINDV